MHSALQSGPTHQDPEIAPSVGVHRPSPRRLKAVEGATRQREEGKWWLKLCSAAPFKDGGRKGVKGSDWDSASPS
eukprot:scaffold15405_cov119-Isochrysis_galbana.AAC.9